MAKEFRCIIFSNQEVIAAFLKRKQRMRELLPSGSILGIEFSNSESGAKSVLRISEDSGNRVNVEIKESEMAASLVEFCLERNIPMPRHSTKSLEANRDNELTLLLYMDDCIPKANAKKNIKPKSLFTIGI